MNITIRVPFKRSYSRLQRKYQFVTMNGHAYKVSVDVRIPKRAFSAISDNPPRYITVLLTDGPVRRLV